LTASIGSCLFAGIDDRNGSLKTLTFIPADCTWHNIAAFPKDGLRQSENLGWQ
jgi:hypothetical protein